MPRLKTIVIGCVDPRVAPNDVLSFELGDAAAIRNVGGRVTPALVQELAMLRKVTQAAGGDIGPETASAGLMSCGRPASPALSRLARIHAADDDGFQPRH